MKADQYVAKLREMIANPPKKSEIYDDTPAEHDGPAEKLDIVIKVCMDLLREAKAIAVARRAQTDEAWIAVVREQDQKWRAIVRRFGADSDVVIHENTFEAFAVSYMKQVREKTT